MCVVCVRVCAGVCTRETCVHVCVHVRVRVHVHVRVRVHAHVRVHVHVRVSARARVHARVRARVGVRVDVGARISYAYAYVLIHTCTYIKSADNQVKISCVSVFSCELTRAYACTIVPPQPPLQPLYLTHMLPLPLSVPLPFPDKCTHTKIAGN